MAHISANSVLTFLNARKLPGQATATAASGWNVSAGQRLSARPLSRVDCDGSGVPRKACRRSHTPSAQHTDATPRTAPTPNRTRSEQACGTPPAGRARNKPVARLRQDALGTSLRHASGLCGGLSGVSGLSGRFRGGPRPAFRLHGSRRRRGAVGGSRLCRRPPERGRRRRSGHEGIRRVPATGRRPPVFRRASAPAVLAAAARRAPGIPVRRRRLPRACVAGGPCRPSIGPDSSCRRRLLRACVAGGPCRPSIGPDSSCRRRLLRGRPAVARVRAWRRCRRAWSRRGEAGLWSQPAPARTRGGGGGGGRRSGRGAWLLGRLLLVLALFRACCITSIVDICTLVKIFGNFIPLFSAYSGGCCHRGW